MAGKAAPKNETPAARFVRLGEGRVNKALDAIGNIGNLVGSSYESTPEQRALIVNALAEAVKTVDANFKNGKTSKTGFKLV